MLLGKVESWEEFISPALPYGRVENGQRSIDESVFSWLKVRSRSRQYFSDRLNRAPREAKSTPPNFLPRQETSDSSDPLLSMQRSVRSGCHQGLSDAPEAEQDRKFALPLSTQGASVCLCGSLWPSVTPLLSYQPSTLVASVCCLRDRRGA